MVISGLQKMSLVDFPGKVAATVFTGGCDLRCPFCHNFELVTHPTKEMETQELLAFLKKRTGLLDGVCITGGEPCLHKDLPDLMRQIRALGFPVKLDTNGNHPDVLAAVLSEKLADYIAIDVKNSPDRYPATVGLEKFELAAYNESLKMLMDSGCDYELRTTVIDELHDEESFLGIKAMLKELLGERKLPHYFLQAFHDRDTVPFEGFHAPPKEKLEAYAAIMSEISQTCAIRGV